MASLLQPAFRNLVATLLVLVALTTSIPQLASAADEDPLQDFCVALSLAEQQQLGLTLNGLPCKPATAVQSSDFASPLLRNPGNFTGKLGSAVNLASAATFGALNTQGLSIARIDYKPRGLNPPHVHPRATEVLFLAEGTLLVGFVSTANQFFYKTLKAGDLFVFPRGLIHFQFNTDKSKPAMAIAALNSQNPGTSQVAAALFASDPSLPDDVLETTFGISEEEVQSLRSSVHDTLSMSY